MDKTSLGDRMKGYENIERRYLPRRMDTIIRIDGKAFHNYTKGFDEPYDKSFLTCMEMTAKDLCENIEGVKLAYTQSDEISLLLTDNETIDTQPWFGKNIQKMVSVAASLATFYFNRHVQDAFASAHAGNADFDGTWASAGLEKAYIDDRLAVFDARVFVLPHEEVLNYFEWRQQDCTRNSIQSAGQTYFSHKQLNYKSGTDIQLMLFKEKDINWNDYPNFFKRGVCVIKRPRLVQTPEGEWVERNKWVIDFEIPIFHQQPNYINNLINWN